MTDVRIGERVRRDRPGRRATTETELVIGYRTLPRPVEIDPAVEALRVAREPRRRRPCAEQGEAR